MLAPATPLTLADVAAMGEGAFVAALGELFEHSPWVAEGAWSRRPFASLDALHEAMMDTVRGTSPAQQIAFLCMHPELAGKEAQAGTMTGHSTFEQHGAGLNALSHEEFLELKRLNAAYRARHGFPFIIAVLGHSKLQIFDALRVRSGRTSAQEVAAALEQIGVITRRRLNALFGATTSPPSTKAKP